MVNIATRLEARILGVTIQLGPYLTNIKVHYYVLIYVGWLGDHCKRERGKKKTMMITINMSSC
jgi:hypothetical protein